MEAFELILLLLVAVLLSSVLDQVVPRISSPLIQIGLGVVIALLAISPIEVSARLFDANVYAACNCHEGKYATGAW